jgi:Cd2+/Zn2+-exporting ATPase
MTAMEPSHPDPDPRRRWLPDELRATVAAGVALLIGYVLIRIGEPRGVMVVGQVLVWLGLGVGLVYGGLAAGEALRERKFDIDVLMVLAAVLAAALGHPEDGGLLLFLFNLSGALEDRAMRRTMRAVEALHRLMPEEALVQRGGEWVVCRPTELTVGERIRVRPGELVAVDAKVVEGRSSVDQSTLTGESLPRTVAEGDDIYAGTLNLSNPVEAVVAKPAAESSLQKVLNLVISAQQGREPVQRFIDRVSGPYAKGVVIVSTLVFLIWFLVFKEPASRAAYTAIALLIVASPCALVIATPTATLAAISRGARAGLLFKGGQAIDRLARMRAVCVDKTGTLTMGRARLQQVHAVAWSDGDQMLRVAAGLEAGSTHPIAKAVTEAARQRGVPPAVVEQAEDVPGRGLSGMVDGSPARLGTMDHCEELVPVCLRARVREVLERVRGRGQIGVVVAWQGGAAGEEQGQAAVLILSDPVRPGAREMVAELDALGVRPIRMLTGDNAATAAYIAEQIGIEDWRAELLPHDKVRILEELKASVRGEGGRGGVGAIGDGVNDAPILAAADVSIGIGTIGSDAALESSDIVTLNDDLRTVSWGVGLARRTRGVVAFNVALALSVIAGMGAATLVGSRVGWDVPLPVAVLAHEGGTLIVVLNSLRLLLVRSPRALGAAGGAEGAGGAGEAVVSGRTVGAPRTV